MKKICATFLALVCAFAFIGCSGNHSNGVSLDSYEYARESTNDMLRFSSSDSGLDNFLNDFLHRHLRYDEKRIDFRDLGSAVTFGKEWEAYSLMFFDTTENVLGNSRQNMLRNYINNVPVDRFGYVWNSQHAVHDDDTRGNVYFHQGWPFPSYTTVNNVRARGWEFANGVVDGWTTSLNGATAMPASADPVNAQGDSKIFLSTQSTSFETGEFISPVMSGNTCIDCEWAPFLEFDIRIDTGNTAWVDDLYVYWKHAGEDWADERKVSYKEFATTGNMEITSDFNRHIYFPMYLHDKWGTEGDISQFKLVVKAKEDGKSHNGTVKLNFVRAQFDTRQTNNIGIFLSTAQKYLEFTGDTATLERNLSRFRMAAQFLLGYCNGTSGLIDRSGFMGHEGSKGGYGVGGEGTSIGNGYWDMLSTPTTSLYANLFYYRAIQSMLYIEQMAAAAGIEKEMPSVWNKTATATVTYADYMTQEGLTGLLDTIREKIQAPVDANSKTGFWDTSKKRFIEGFDSDGDVVDYGYVMYNLEAIASGVATEEQAKDILDWVNGDRIVREDVNEADDQAYATGKKGTAVQTDGSIDSSGTLGIYDFEFAPRVSTVKNREHYYWDWNGQVAYADQLQDGGATMYVSYYDILSRIQTRGASDAFGRLKEIQSWYEKVSAAAKKANADDPDGGYDGKNFYLAYYSELGINLQGTGQTAGEGVGAGTLGLAYEFLESAMLYATVPYGFFGLSAQNNTLCITPEMPEKLSWWKMENLLYRGVHYDLTIAKDGAQIDYVRGDTDGLQVTVSLVGKAGSKVYVNGKETESVYDSSTGRHSVTVPLKACSVQIR